MQFCRECLFLLLTSFLHFLVSIKYVAQWKHYDFLIEFTDQANEVSVSRISICKHAFYVVQA